ncbi:serine/arginine repetitive matrix protein 1 isoform X1 [Drosophila innubila]|uniref:serine/arginine repetitive matrix protein 1 isoform X1 n=2 Tax=Drosophila innubila TaxID=198719 RepID=UPI00148DF5B8|nr:serine/arginine repetitive matrix protein 1 isoform X1 [Drosophila innubila]XP_034476735.1 serine/arginine repetitive matrix protein 1 isoform X1 [Drosophila innubila]
MASRRRPDLNPKLHMDRQPTAARITDPSLPAGKRREIDNVMKKARANTTNDYWDKKLIEAEEKDPNRWRHTGYKKMYIQGESSSGESERDSAQATYSRYPGVPPNSGPPPPSSSSSRYGRSRSPHSRSRSRLRKSPPLSPPPPSHARRRSPPPQFMDRRPVMSPPSPHHNGPPPMRGRPRSPPMPPRSMPRSPNNHNNNHHNNSNNSDMLRRPGNGHGRPRSPPEPATGPSSSQMRRKPTNASRSPLGRRRSPPLPPPASSSSGMEKRGMGPAHILPRSKRPPSPPPRHSMRSRSNSSMSSSSDDSCSLCSPSHRHRSRSRGPRSPPPKPRGHYRGAGAPPPLPPPESHGRLHGRPTTPPPARAGVSGGIDKYREAKMRHISHERATSSDVHMKVGRASRHSPPPEDPRLKHRPPEPPEPAAPTAAAAPQVKKKKKEKELRTRVKIEGEKRKKHTSATVATSGSGNNANSSSDSDDSGGSDSDEATPALPSFSATTRLTLSERFGKMAQWSIDRSNMENMRITKDSAGGALKVMIEEGLESPPRRYSYSPAPAGHFPEELATTAPSGMLSWDDVRVRYEYYKSRGYLRDLDLKDYIKWEEWWYKYQEWLKQERYYEYWDRSQQMRRRRKKLPVTQRLN